MSYDNSYKLGVCDSILRAQVEKDKTSKCQKRPNGKCQHFPANCCFSVLLFRKGDSQDSIMMKPKMMSHPVVLANQEMPALFFFCL